MADSQTPRSHWEVLREELARVDAGLAESKQIQEYLRAQIRTAIRELESILRRPLRSKL